MSITTYRITDGRQVRAVRAMLGMTQAELGQAAGVHRMSINNAEKRQRLPPRSWAAEQVAKYGAENGIVADVVDGVPVVRVQSPAA
ncbi:helix-turn-helix transcriptional regulator [Aureimonas endophytica]|nr:helix-turn-helix domain-containing protein [Aureimonas endophytica]